MSKPVEIEFLIKDNMSQGITKASRNVDGLTEKAAKANSEVNAVNYSVQELRNIIALLEAQLEELQVVGKNASPDLDQSDNIAKIEALQLEIRELEEQLAQLEKSSADVNVVPSDLPQATKTFNGLHMSIQQIAREMPTLAMGPQMFFLAISNNLPIFADEVKRARTEYQALVAAGQKGTPVWKQILSSLFSWQTALTTGIMLLVMYGDEIVNWVKDLFTAKDGVDEFNISLEEMAEIEKNGRAEMIRTRFELDNLANELKNYSGTKEEEKQKVDELNRKYGEAFGYYETVAEWYDIITQKSEDYIQMLFLQAKAQSLVNKAIEADEKLTEVKNTAADDVEGSLNWFQKMGLYMVQSEMSTVRQSYDAKKVIEDQNEQAKKEAIAAAQAVVTGYLKEADELTKQAAQIGKASDIGGHTSPTSKTNTSSTRYRISTEKEYNKELIALLRQNTEDEIALMKEGTEKKLAEIKEDYNKRIAEIAELEAEFKNKNKEAGVSTDSNGLTAEQSDALNAAKLNAEEKYAEETRRVNEELARAELESMRNYLKEYGTYQQQKLAIAEEYAEKIKNAQTEGDRLSLTAERDRQLQQVEINAIKQNIDWGSVFGDFGTIFKGQLEPTLESLRTIANSDEMKNATIEERQALHELITKLEQANTVWDSDIFQTVSDDMIAYQDAMNRYIEAQERERIATENLTQAKETLKNAENNLAQATATGSAKDVDNATIAYTNAKAAVTAASKEVTAAASATKLFGTEVQDATEELKESSQAAVNQFQLLQSGLQGLTSGNLQGIGGGLMELDKLFNNSSVTNTVGTALAKGMNSLLGKDSSASKAITEALGSAGFTGEIIAAALGIMDILKEGISTLVSDLIDTVLNAINGILQDLFSLDMATKVGTSIVQGVGGILDTVTFGGFSSWVGNGESDETLAEDLERLTLSNQDLQQSIDNLADKMDDASTGEALDIYETQKANIEEMIANTQEMMQRASASYSNGFLGIGGEHSSSHEINEGMSASDWEAISAVVGRTIDSAADFWSLTSEEMYNVANEATTQYTKLKDLADNGHADAAQYMDEYITYWQQLEDIQNAYYEKMTSYSFDDIESEFKSQLLDMETDAEDFADSFEDMMKQAVVNSMMSNTYSKKLKEWYEAFADSLESDGELTSAEQEALRSQYEAIVNSALKERDALIDAMNWDVSSSTSQSAKTGSFDTMTQDQGTKLEGMFTSGLQHWSSMDERLEDVAEKMDTAEGHLARIAENTGASAGHLSEIKEDIKKMIRDGLKVK
ncbi:MAG: viral A-type inclusion protein [Prevotellaceae bacterium]|nr:viral A-type inclusion protein [Prevotellaceae bacterium]